MASSRRISSANSSRPAGSSPAAGSARWRARPRATAEVASSRTTSTRTHSSIWRASRAPPSSARAWSMTCRQVAEAPEPPSSIRPAALRASPPHLGSPTMGHSPSRGAPARPPRGPDPARDAPREDERRDDRADDPERASEDRRDDDRRDEPPDDERRLDDPPVDERRDEPGRESEARRDEPDSDERRDEPEREPEARRDDDRRDEPPDEERRLDDPPRRGEGRDDDSGTAAAYPDRPGRKRRTRPRRASFKEKSGGDLLSQGVSSQVPSALVGLTSVFGMGTGVTPPLWPPKSVVKNEPPPGSPWGARALEELHSEHERHCRSKPSAD